MRSVSTRSVVPVVPYLLESMCFSVSGSSKRRRSNRTGTDATGARNLRSTAPLALLNLSSNRSEMNQHPQRLDYIHHRSL